MNGLPNSSLPVCDRCGGPQFQCSMCGEVHCCDANCGEKPGALEPASYIAVRSTYRGPGEDI